MLPGMDNALGRVPVLMSSLALLLSSYSLLLGLNARPSSTIPRATAEPFSAVNEVRIEGLKIHAGQLASGAVHTAHIADASVTGSKLADGAVGMGKLSGEILSSIARGGNVLLGEIDEAGRRIKGRPEGFQATKLGKGDYNLTFAKDVFQDPPVVIAVAQSYGTCFVPPSGALAGVPVAVRLRLRPQGSLEPNGCGVEVLAGRASLPAGAFTHT